MHALDKQHRLTSKVLTMTMTCMSDVRPIRMRWSAHSANSTLYLHAVRPLHVVGG